MHSVQSSTHAIAAAADVWRAMVDIVIDRKIEQGRGCVFHEQGADSLEYISLFDWQQRGAGDIDPGIYAQLLALIGGGYNFQSEFVLLAKSTHQGQVKYVFQVGQLSYDGWRGVKTPQQIQAQEAMSQRAIAQQVRQVFRQQRQSKKKRK